MECADFVVIVSAISRESRSSAAESYHLEHPIVPPALNACQIGEADSKLLYTVISSSVPLKVSL